MTLDTDVIIIGAGMSGISMAIQLMRKQGIRMFEIIEKSDNVGGTWFTNSYPGCGCDVPSHFYSYSFALNPDWPNMFSLQPEIQEYFVSVAQKNGVTSHVRFNTEVERAYYNSEKAMWNVEVRNHQTKTRTTRRCKILISAVGGLSIPKECEIPGWERFKGPLFHSARWDHDFNYKDKEVICIGNGCSATQFVPVMSEGPDRVKKITQFSRQAHWLHERKDVAFGPTFKFVMRYVPLAMRAFRFMIYYLLEREFAGFPMDKGEKTRGQWVEMVTEYIKRTAPEKYHEALIPKSVIGCKRRVLDTGYLACLHKENVELIHNDPIEQITETGVRTKSGRKIHADAIVLATGFQTQTPLFPMEIRGRSGESIQDHWREFGAGSAEAYFGTCLSNFPNFFILMGPNTLSGHLSVVYTTECQIEFVLKLIAPVLKPLHRSVISELIGYPYPESVEVKNEAEIADVEKTHKKLKDLVFASGCTSWNIDENTGRNTVMWPDYQWKYWWRCIFVTWKDIEYRWSEKDGGGKARGRFWMFLGGLIASIVGAIAFTTWWIMGESAQEILSSAIDRVRTFTPASLR